MKKEKSLYDAVIDYQNAMDRRAWLDTPDGKEYCKQKALELFPQEKRDEEKAEIAAMIETYFCNL